MSSKKIKTKMKAEVTPTTKGSKAIKPKFGRGTGGIMTTSVKLMVKDIKAKKKNG